jgi:hypothetical protein
MARSATDIQADLDAAYAARRATLLGQSYSLDTGQGRQQVTRADLGAISELISLLENEMAEATGTDVLITGSLQRHG